ncbi:sigma-70 family RNA polymerase sigma factor [Plasticicumulans sp.]|uniref:sigma-70 family RNA polymerase sigma factor n=1 Tax=Plasticicumulans sp. TaxID=2307179 RepID=UPI002D175738|nr:sigma-70 family RNA polymerase sigma factor [Plasticicumulans sp.]MBS0603380.1 sigma-70 family RNA polymerase sigma factor [Pseudomonadota bacterium]HMV39324.1 sigma-70 family RNA polymerase sigma factor [Plasticicumulans sp.]HMW29728.1 sigma-70 family RNA polymerase sigma factor [Plasticicumulans sp.]HMW43058.1 sigma-70 family RNA polymerase sigma factor [Plasticicumulans sp.]HMZ11057.1 sigma-70 family RNA polymerase sigma factor [Plasticicumulans sp.]
MSVPEVLEDLLARTALADRHAFEKLYRLSSAQLFGIVLRIVRDRDLAADVLQETYVKIWHRAGDFRADLAQPLTWMGSIARHQAIDTLRRSARRLSTAEDIDEHYELADEAAESPADAVDRGLQGAALHRCLGELQGLQQRAVQLAWFRGLTHEDIAARLDTPLGTVKSWLRRGLLRLKTCLEGA